MHAPSTRIASALLAVSALAASTSSALGAGGSSPPAAASDDLVELGRRLFFDPAASSRAGMRSCADCHDPRHGWSDSARTSEDARGRTRRHSQTLIDVADSPRFHWDGEFATVAKLIATRISSDAPALPPVYYERAPVGGFAPDVDAAPDPDGLPPDYEPDMPVLQPDVGPQPLPTTLLNRQVLFRDSDFGMPPPKVALARDGRYREAFGVFPEHTVTDTRLVRAVAEFCHSIRSGTSAYDRYAAGDTTAMSDSAVRGLALFRGSAGCVSCHAMEGARPAFTDHGFHVVPGIQSDPKDPGAKAHGLGAEGSFKTPTLRDVASHAPYGHDGRWKTLEQAVAEFVGVWPHGDLRAEPALPLPVHDLCAFLRALSSDERPGRARIAWRARAPKTRLRLVDADGLPLSDRPLTLIPCGDALPGYPAPTEIVGKTNLQGWFEYAPPATTHVRLALPGGLRPLGGTWIPDTCRETTIALPLRGVARVQMDVPAGRDVPKVLVARHVASLFFPEHHTPISVLVLETSRKGPRSVTAIYRTEARTDVPSTVQVRVPLPGTPRATYESVDLAPGTTQTVRATVP